MKQLIHYKRHILILVTIGIPFFMAVYALYRGDVSLWYDPARDLLSAWNNVSKPTLIGPTSGIPGIFYGPYWIWLLSIGVFVSKDPSVVSFITATLPYFILFPLIWFRFTKFFGFTAVLCGWLLFILTTGKTYSTQLWNPYPAPLFTIFVIYLLSVINFSKVTKYQLLLSGLLGFFVALIITFHISFGIGLLCGVLIFLLVEFLYNFIKTSTKQRKQLFITRLIMYSVILLGFFVAYIPTLLFEIRHGFNQIQTLIQTLTQYGDVVQVKGLPKPLIAQEFVETFGKLTMLPVLVAGITLLVVTGIFVYNVFTKKVKLQQTDTRILMVILSLFAGILFIYFTARNPVWEYHFIGVEVLFLVLLTFIVSKLSFFKPFYILLACFISFVALIDFQTKVLDTNTSGLHNHKMAVQTIVKDAKNQDYTVIAYSPSIYMYEYSYLFKWLADKDISYDPGAHPKSNTIYLIIPKDGNPNVDYAKVKDFVNFRSPSSEFKTEKSWEIPYNKILKQMRKQ